MAQQGRVVLDYVATRQILALLAAASPGTPAPGDDGNALILRLARQLPEAELGALPAWLCVRVRALLDAAGSPEDYVLAIAPARR